MPYDLKHVTFPSLNSGFCELLNVGHFSFQAILQPFVNQSQKFETQIHCSNLESDDTA